jgi:ribose transport system permease protein
MLSRLFSGETMPQSITKTLGFDWRRYIVFIAFVAVFVVFSITLYDSGFLSFNNLFNIVRQTAIIGVMAVAMTFVISAAEIDLSVGAVAGLGSVTSALAVSEYGLVAGIVVGILTGLVVGGVNGLLVATIGIPSFLVTLGMMGIARGSAMWVTDSAPIPIVNNTFNNVFGSGQIGPIPSLFLWLLILLIIGMIVLRKTTYGRRVLATGGNEAAARFSGVRTRMIKFYVLLFSGAAAGLAGMLYAGRLHSGRFQFGEGDELSVIAAVILGGTSLFGGYGTVIGSVLGALLVGLINNGLTLMGVEFSQQQVVRGAIIILAVALARKGPGS